MKVEHKVNLSESTKNIIENLACRIAEKQGGRITPNHLAPYLPVSLVIVKSCLDDMVDGTSVFSEGGNNITEYEFAAYKNAKQTTGILKVDACVSCDVDISSLTNDVLCPRCFEILKEELNTLAERIGWPAQAVYEHEILYITSNHKSSVYAETLAGHSRYTLRRMRGKLDRMSGERYVKQELEEEQGMFRYRFPEIEYPRDLYKKNISLIKTYPASVMEEVQLKLTRILFSLGLIVLGLLVMGFFHVPFRLLILLFIITAPITAITIWRRKDRVEEE